MEGAPTRVPRRSLKKVGHWEGYSTLINRAMMWAYLFLRAGICQILIMIIWIPVSIWREAIWSVRKDQRPDLNWERSVSVSELYLGMLEYGRKEKMVPVKDYVLEDWKAKEFDFNVRRFEKFVKTVNPAIWSVSYRITISDCFGFNLI